MNPQIPRISARLRQNSPVKQRLLSRSTKDHLCAVMLSLGYSSQYIEKETGLSPGAISYRVKLCNLRRRDYRNGTSNIAATILQVAVKNRQVDANLEREIVKGLAQMEREKRNANKTKVAPVPDQTA